MRPSIPPTLTILVALAATACDTPEDAPFAPSKAEAAEARSEALVEPGLLRAILEERAAYGPTADAQHAGALALAGQGDAAACTTIDFEGVADLGPVGTIGEAAFGSSWYGLVDTDAGGSGPFANEPSPSTVALILDEADIDLVLAAPVAYVSLHYSALDDALPLSLEGLDDADQVVASALGTTIGADLNNPPCSGDPEGWFCGWEPLEISSPTPTISVVRLRGPVGTEAAWAIDDLTLCTSAPGDGTGQEVAIDIKPGSDENTINPKSNGKVKVALLGGDDLDVDEVDLSSLTLGDGEGDDTPVAEKGRGRPMAQTVDVNSDGRPDLMLHFDVGALVANGDLTWETTELLLRGSWAGDEGSGDFYGSDAVRVVPDARDDG